MNNGHSNGSRNNSGHHIVASLDGVFQYDQTSSESGSGKMGKLCICQLGISLIVSGSDDSDICHHETVETSFYTSLPNLKNCFLSVDGKMSDLGEMTEFEDIQVEKLILYCKDFREVVLHFKKGDETLYAFLKTLQDKVYRKIGSPSADLCGRSSPSSICSFLDKSSWERELSRLKINIKKSRWKVVENKEFKSCGITGKYFVVPSSISVESVTATGEGHTNNRYMSWCWTDSDTMVSLLRCSEPQTILNNSYLNKILYTVNNGRAKTHAVMSTAHLKDSCPNETVISTSFEKLWNACLVKDGEYFYKNLESSKWFHHIHSLIRASRHIARTLKCDKNPVVVMDETGRDMSCLVVSLVLIICDKHFRTIAGFANLINKEWLSAGYSFCSSLMSIKGTESHFYPTFIMFLDCVHNIILQYPTEFEFTDLYLMEILDKILTGESEVFMFNCPRDISLVCKGKENDVVDDFWQKVLKQKSKYVNPLFDLQDKILKTPSETTSFDETLQVTRTQSYSYAVSKGTEDVGGDKKPIKKERSGILMLKAIRKPSHLFHKGRRKSKKMKKDKPGKVGSSSFFSAESESPRERLTSMKNIFKSKFDPINVNYSIINIHLWYRYYYRHIVSSEIHSEGGNALVATLVNDIKLSSSDFISSHCSEDSADVAGEETSSSDITKMIMSEPDYLDEIQRSDSLTTINSGMERSIHVSEIDLCNDHVDKDYESAEELSLNGLSMEGSIELPATATAPATAPAPAPVPEGEKRLSEVMEEPEMSNTKSPQTVVLEIAEAANDVQDF